MKPNVGKVWRWCVTTSVPGSAKYDDRSLSFDAPNRRRRPSCDASTASPNRCPSSVDTTIEINTLRVSKEAQIEDDFAGQSHILELFSSANWRLCLPAMDTRPCTYTPDQEIQ